MAYEPAEKIVVSGFELEDAEKSIVDNIVTNYKNKINRKIGYKEIKIDMKKSRHGNEFLHEINGTLVVPSNAGVKGKNNFNADASGYNLFSCLAETFEKLLKEADSKKRKPKGNPSTKGKSPDKVS